MTRTVATTPTLAAGLTLSNHGTMNFGVNGYFTCGDCTLTNEADGSIRLYNPDGAFTYGFAVDSGTFDNQGLVRLTGYLPGTWVRFGTHVSLIGHGAGKAVVDGLVQPSWIDNLRSGATVPLFATALTQSGLADLASNALTAAQASLPGLGIAKCKNVNVGISIVGASTGVCKVVDANHAEAVVLSVSGSIGLGFDPTEPFTASSLLSNEPSVSIDIGGQLLWTRGTDQNFTIDDLDGLSICKTGTIVIGIGGTGQQCWGPKDGVPYALGDVPLDRPGVHSAYLGVVLGTPNISDTWSLSYSVTIACGQWYSLTLQVCSPSNRTPPSIPASPTVDQQLTANAGEWAQGSSEPPFSLTYHYQWQRCPTTDLASCRPIPGATSQTYTPTAADAGTSLTVAVSASNDGGSSAPVNAHRQGPVQ